MERTITVYDGTISAAGEDDDNGDGKGEYLAQPNWVAYHLKRTEIYESYSKRKWYRLDLFDVERKRSSSNKPIDKSYSGEGSASGCKSGDKIHIDRGHLAKREDLNRLGGEYGCNSHVFANAVPQNCSQNQHDSWAELEDKIAEIVNDQNNNINEAWIVAGPIYEKNKKVRWIGDDDEVPIAVPDALFKVVYFETEVDFPSIYAFRFANQPDDKDYCKNLKPLKDIEDDTGLSFKQSPNNQNVIEPILCNQ